MSTVNLLAGLLQKGVELEVANGKLRCRAPHSNYTICLINHLVSREHKEYTVFVVLGNWRRPNVATIGKYCKAYLLLDSGEPHIWQKARFIGRCYVAGALCPGGAGRKVAPTDFSQTRSNQRVKIQS